MQPNLHMSWTYARLNRILENSILKWVLRFCKRSITFSKNKYFYSINIHLLLIWSHFKFTHMVKWKRRIQVPKNTLLIFTCTFTTKSTFIKWSIGPSAFCFIIKHCHYFSCLFKANRFWATYAKRFFHLIFNRFFINRHSFLRNL